MPLWHVAVHDPSVAFHVAFGIVFCPRLFARKNFTFGVPFTCRPRPVVASIAVFELATSRWQFVQP